MTTNGTNRSYRLDPDDDEISAALIANEEAGRETEIDPDVPLPDDGTVIVRTTDGDGPLEGLAAYERSDRWEFAWTDHEKAKYRALEMRPARHGGSLIRGKTPAEVDGEERMVEVYVRVKGKTPKQLRESPGGMEPQLSTQARAAARALEAEEDEEAPTPAAD